MSGAGGNPAQRFILPVSGLAVTLSPLTGVEELLLAEGDETDPALALALVARVAHAEPEPDWAALSVTDIDTILLRLRQFLLGETISANLRCPAEGCGARVEFTFAIPAYLAHHAPRPARGRGWAAKPAADGWYRLEAGREKANFRLPALADLIAAAGAADGAAVLRRECVREEALPARALARVQVAMERLAPVLAGELAGACPDCARPIGARFEARRFCLRELRDRARFIYEDVDALAQRYHWPEAEILALPQGRRAQYAELARQAARAA